MLILILSLGATVGYLVGYQLGHKKGALDERAFRDRLER